MRRAWVLLVSLWALSPGLAHAQSPAQPDSLTQPLRDGCERDPEAIAAGLEPQWVYVNRDPKPQYVSGLVVDARPNFEDVFRTHESYDMNVFVRPDPGFEHLLGTANTRPDQAPIDQDTIEIEWEQRAYPMFAWPTAGDRVEVLGSWVWDCGHWGQTTNDPGYLVPGTLPGEANVVGERTEIHPPRLVIVHRSNPSTSPRGASVTDVFLSSDGTLARAIADRAAGGCGEPEATRCPRLHPVTDRDYQFEILAPERPPGANRLAWTSIERGSQNVPEPVVAETDRGLAVRLPLQASNPPGQPVVFARTFEVGWDVAAPVVAARVRIERLEWLAELDGPRPGFCPGPGGCSERPQQSSPPDEVNLYVEAGGQWTQLSNPGLLSFLARPGSWSGMRQSRNGRVRRRRRIRLQRRCRAP